MLQGHESGGPNEVECNRMSLIKPPGGAAADGPDHARTHTYNDPASRGHGNRTARCRFPSGGRVHPRQDGAAEGTAAAHA